MIASIFRERNGKDDNCRTLTFSLSAAYVIMLLTTIFVLTFRAVSKRLEACSRERRGLRI